MKRLLPLVALLLAAPVFAGCATGAPSAGASATPTPARSATATPTPTPSVSVTPEPIVVLAPEVVEPAVPIDPPTPADPNSVDPADYVSTAIDEGNGGIPLAGVAFTVADGAITCGILTAGHPGSTPGFVSCTPDTYREVLPQPVPEGPLYVKSIMSDPVYGPAGLYPDWFKQPERAVPALPDGKNLRYEGTVCSAAGEGVTCIHADSGKGFFLSPASYTYFQ